jgi:hypothetical protein
MKLRVPSIKENQIDKQQTKDHANTYQVIRKVLRTNHTPLLQKRAKIICLHNSSADPGP